MPQVGRRSRKVIDERYLQIVWEHSHVVFDDQGFECRSTAPESGVP